MSVQHFASSHTKISLVNKKKTDYVDPNITNYKSYFPSRHHNQREIALKQKPKTNWWIDFMVCQLLLEFFIIKGFQTIVFIFVISTTFWLICPPAFFRCLSTSGTYTEFELRPFIESTRGSPVLILLAITRYKC